MPYCQQCQKFASLELGDPEVNNEPEFNNGTVTASVRIVRSCTECSTEMRDYEFEMEQEADVIHVHPGESEPEYRVEAEGDPEIEEVKLGKNKKPNKRGTTFFQVKYQYSVYCTCKKEPIYEGEFADEVRASDMNEV